MDRANRKSGVWKRGLDNPQSHLYGIAICMEFQSLQGEDILLQLRNNICWFCVHPNAVKRVQGNT